MLLQLLVPQPKPARETEAQSRRRTQIVAGAFTFGPLVDPRTVPRNNGSKGRMSSRHGGGSCQFVSSYPKPGLGTEAAVQEFSASANADGGGRLICVGERLL